MSELVLQPATEGEAMTSYPFDLMGHPLEDGFTLVEASAGTGKTYSITWLVTRLILERALEIHELLVVTFTVAATEEMKSRIRAHIADCLARWEDVERVGRRLSAGESIEALKTAGELIVPQELLVIYGRLDQQGREGAHKRLQRALDRFDEAQISTIHGFCSQALKEHATDEDVDTGRVQTHLLPLFDEVIDDYRSLVFSQSSLQSLRLMESLKQSLNLDRAKSLMPVIRKLEVGGWAQVYCDPLSLPSRVGEAQALFVEDETEESKRDEADRDEIEADLNAEGLARLRALIEEPSEVSPEDVIRAWGEVALSFTSSLIRGPLGVLIDQGQHQSLADSLQEMNAQAKWNKGAGPEAQEAAWGALAQLQSKLKAAQEGALSPSRILLPDEDLPPEAELLGTLIALKKELEVLSCSKITAGLSKTAKKANAPFYDFTHPLSVALDQLAELLDRSADMMRTWFRRGFVEYCQRELPARKRALGVVSTDDLIHLTRAALSRQNSKMCSSLRARYRAALLDEFQDTDPSQWDVFNLVFGDGHAPVYLIGDPKQSIYRFRGADLNAYLAVKEMTPAHRRFTMSRNFRSDPRLLNVLNQLFDPQHHRFIPTHLELAPAGRQSEGEAFFGDERIPYIHVDGGRPNRMERTPALLIKYLPCDLKVKADGDLPERVAADICAYLRSGAQVWPKGVGVGEPRSLRVSDIGVLTRTNGRANLIARALARRGIPSNVRNDDSVFKTHSAMELELLLRGVLMPHDDDALRASLSVDALALTAQEVRVNAAGAREVFTELHALWQERGLAASFQRLLYHPEVKLVERILRQPSGAQTLTHLTHLIELLQAYALQMRLSPELTLQWLRERRLEEGGEVDEGDKVRPHIDGEAVEVVTIHRSKGLEYPVLYCPDLWCGTTESFEGKDYATVLEPPSAGEQRSLDLRLLDDSPPEPTRAQALDAVKISLQREYLRLLYVALTRPLHQLHIYLSLPSRGFYPHPILDLLAGPALELSKKPTRLGLEGALLEAIPDRVSTSDGEVRWEVLEEHIETRSWVDSDAQERPLAVHEPVNSATPSWRASSFSALTRVVHEAQQQSFFLEERPEVDEEAQSKALAPVSYDGPTPPLIELPRLARSARFGQCVHALLERLEFTEAHPEPLHRHCLDALRTWGLPFAWSESLAQGISLALQTPLSGAGEGLCLAELSRPLRRDEVSFEISLNQEKPVSAQLLNEILSLDPASAQLPPFPDDFCLSGYLKGSIDLMFRHPHASTEDGVGRYMIADYKTNWLGEGSGDEATSSLAHYHPLSLERVMREHLYLLQSHIYLVALHRLLKVRLGERYRYERHCGGSVYLFLRGMAGQASVLPAEPGRPTQVAGVYTHRPPPVVIELLDLAFEDATRAQLALNELQMDIGGGG